MAKFRTDIFGVKSEQKWMTDRHAFQNEAGSGKDKITCCDSWIDHWKNQTGSKRARCAYLGCSKETEHGAQIRFYDTDKMRFLRTRWMIPLCPSHNHPSRKNLFYIDKRCELAPHGKTGKCFKTAPAANKNKNFCVKVRKKKPKLSCTCASPLDHYHANADSKRTRCLASPCGKPAQFVVSIRSEDGRRKVDNHLALLCKAHHATTDAFFIESTGYLVVPGKTRKCSG